MWTPGNGGVMTQFSVLGIMSTKLTGIMITNRYYVNKRCCYINNTTGKVYDQVQPMHRLLFQEPTSPPFSSTFIHFHPLIYIFIHFDPLRYIYCYPFHPLSSVFIHFIQFYPFLEVSRNRRNSQIPFDTESVLEQEKWQNPFIFSRDLVFLLDPGIPGVWFMGPSVLNSLSSFADLTDVTLKIPMQY